MKSPLVLANPAIPMNGKKPWTTPRYYRVQRVLVLAFTALLFLVGQSSLRSMVTTVNTIGHDAAPSIIAAQEIGSALADLDSNGANYLLGTREHGAAAMSAFEVRRTQATKRIVDAAENVTYGDAEKVPILTMIENIGRYLELFSEARYRHDAGDLPGSVMTYEKATELMHGVILPAANELDRANKSFMNDSYAAQQYADGHAEFHVSLVGGLLAAALLWAQFFMLKRARRIVNAPLFGATVLAVAFTIYSVGCFKDVGASLKLAKEDAFESIHALWQARAIAFDANGDESRYLLDRDRSMQFETNFRTKVASLTTSPAPTSAELSLLSRGQGPTFKGLFANELSNITFVGELPAAVAMTEAFGRYYSTDTRIRSLATSGKRADAIELCIGNGADESNAVFAKFDDALEKVVAINKSEFDRAIDASSHTLRVAEYLNPVAALLIGLLALLGFRARLREYDA